MQKMFGLVIDGPRMVEKIFGAESETTEKHSQPVT
jgi:hypothetical protein